MRSLVILALVALATAGPTQPRGGEPDNPNYDIVRQIVRNGYPVQQIGVTTRDGYILQIFRIPGPREYLQEWNNSEKKSTGKTVVLLMHGMLGSADEYVVGGRERGLAYKLADRGFDVFMGNARGSKYARRHTVLNPDYDRGFWRYTWDQVGKIDVPAIIEQITKHTGEKKMHYIGYNQGNTAFFVMASSLPQYNSRIRKMIALGPMVYMQNAHHALMSQVRANLQNHHWISKHVGVAEFNPSQDLLNSVRRDCKNQNIDEQVCDNAYFLVNGYSQNLNQTIVPELRAQKPYGTSIRQILHYAQVLNSAGFGSYDYAYIADGLDNEGDSSSSSSEESSERPSGSPSVEPLGQQYDLRAVTAHTYLLYVPSDSWANDQDINKLANALTDVKETYAFKNYKSNVDLILAEDAYQKVHEKVLNILQ